ncbi:MAG: hypothetical protein ACK4P3_01020 [Fimbriimonadaceae bacterium]
MHQSFPFLYRNSTVFQDESSSARNGLVQSNLRFGATNQRGFSQVVHSGFTHVGTNVSAGQSRIQRFDGGGPGTLVNRTQDIRYGFGGSAFVYTNTLEVFNGALLALNAVAEMVLGPPKG